MQSMKKLKCLDILWTFKIDIKRFLLLIQYPAYGQTIQELTIREQLKDSSFHEAFCLALDEWTALKLRPLTLNIVTKAIESVIPALKQWIPTWNCKLISAHHHGVIKVYSNFNLLVGWIPTFPTYQIFFSLQNLLLPFVFSTDYGMLGLPTDKDRIILYNHLITNGDKETQVHQGVIPRCWRYHIQCKPLTFYKDLNHITHFNASKCSFLNSTHLEQLATACPNLQILNLLGNINCLKNLCGLRAIASSCQKLEGLNILEISLRKIGDYMLLWEILINLQLSYLAIEWCCVLLDSPVNKQNVHQKCVKMKALESRLAEDCWRCTSNRRLPLLLSNFPSLIHCMTEDIVTVDISERLKYLQYINNKITYSWSLASCNLEQLCIESDQLFLSRSEINALSGHGGLVHVILSVRTVGLPIMTALIQNSPHLITFHVYISTASALWHTLSNTRDFTASLERKFPHRKLFLCGGYRFVKGKISLVT